MTKENIPAAVLPICSNNYLDYYITKIMALALYETNNLVTLFGVVKFYLNWFFLLYSMGLNVFCQSLE